MLIIVKITSINVCVCIYIYIRKKTCIYQMALQKLEYLIKPNLKLLISLFYRNSVFNPNHSSLKICPKSNFSSFDLVLEKYTNIYKFK